MKTLLLDTNLWDLCKDASGNIALASEPYSLAQDAASAMLTFMGEDYYDTTIGVPYRQQIFGKNVSLEFVKGQLEAAAKTVPGVVSAVVTIASFNGRKITGQVQVTDSAGNTTTTGFGA